MQIMGSKGHHLASFMGFNFKGPSQRYHKRSALLGCGVSKIDPGNIGHVSGYTLRHPSFDTQRNPAQIGEELAITEADLKINN